MTVAELHQKDIKSLTQLAQELEIEDIAGLRKQELIYRILRSQMDEDGLLGVEGVLEILPEGFGFLRSAPYNFLPGPDDIFVPPQVVHRDAMCNGDTVTGQARAPRDREHYLSLVQVDTLNGADTETARLRIHFDNLTPYYAGGALAPRNGA